MNKGFTLVEILVVIALMVTATVIVVPNFRKFNEGQDLTQAVNDLKQALRVAQSSATSGTKCSSFPASKWKVSLASTQFTTIAVCYDQSGATSPAPELRQTVIPPPSISISVADNCGSSGTAGAEISFTGNTVSFSCNNGTIPPTLPLPLIIKLKSTNTNLSPQDVSLTAGGLIY